MSAKNTPTNSSAVRRSGGLRARRRLGHHCCCRLHPGRVEGEGRGAHLLLPRHWARSRGGRDAHVDREVGTS